MAFEPKPNSGVLFKTKEKKNEKAPDMYGSIEIEPDYLQHLISESNGGLVKVKINAWKNTSTSGSSYLGLRVDTYRDPKDPAVQTSAAKDPWDE